MRIPVTVGFDQDKLIGWLDIMVEEDLPTIPDYHFALGYEVLDMDKDGNVLKYKLREVSVVSDHLFKALK